MAVQAELACKGGERQRSLNSNIILSKISNSIVITGNNTIIVIKLYKFALATNRQCPGAAGRAAQPLYSPILLYDFPLNAAADPCRSAKGALVRKQVEGECIAMSAAASVVTGTDKIIATKEAGIGWLIFNNPARRNAVSPEMCLAAADVLEDFALDPAVRVVILRGAGDTAFVSGADISQLADQFSTVKGRASWDNTWERSSRQLSGMDKPTIAMISGYCLGGGMIYALSCDLRIGSDTARFGIPAAKLSIGYSVAYIRQLMELVGPSAAKEVLYTARQYTAAEALRMGMVNQVVPREELESVTRACAEVIVNNAPLAIINAKTAVNELLKDAGKRNMALVSRYAEAVTASQDHVEGRKAFLEKRKPVFKRR